MVSLFLDTLLFVTLTNRTGRISSHGLGCAEGSEARSCGHLLLYLFVYASVCLFVCLTLFCGHSYVVDTVALVAKAALKQFPKFPWFPGLCVFHASMATSLKRRLCIF